LVNSSWIDSGSSGVVLSGVSTVGAGWGGFALEQVIGDSRSSGSANRTRLGLRRAVLAGSCTRTGSVSAGSGAASKVSGRVSSSSGAVGRLCFFSTV